MAKPQAAREPVSHIMLSPSPIPIRMLCDIQAAKAPKGDAIADSEAPHTATCPSCKELFENLTVALRAKLDRQAAGPSSLDRYYEWAHAGDSGTSSKTIVQALTGAKVLGRWAPGRPRDAWDFGRCHRMLEKLPELRARLHEVADVYPEWRGLVDAWGELEALYVEELPEQRFQKLWERLRRVI